MFIRGAMSADNFIGDVASNVLRDHTKTVAATGCVAMTQGIELPLGL